MTRALPRRGAIRRNLVNCLGVDDAPFTHAHRGDVKIYAPVFARTRMDGLLVSRVRRDGANATARIAELLLSSPFDHHVRAILLQGIALAGFNVVDVPELAERTSRPVLAVARRQADTDAMRIALEKLPGGAAKWRRVQRAGPMEACAGVFVQRAGLSLDEAAYLVENTRLHGALPEPLRVAHLIAGGATTGTSRGRA